MFGRRAYVRWAYIQGAYTRDVAVSCCIHQTIISFAYSYVACSFDKFCGFFCTKFRGILFQGGCLTPRC